MIGYQAKINMATDLSLLMGVDIPFPEARVNIHQPRLKEIAVIGEEQFFIGCDLLKISKNSLLEQDKAALEDKTNFDILIAILRDRNALAQKNAICAKMLLALLFPEYSISYEKENIILGKEEEQFFIDSSNFNEFQGIIKNMFSFDKKEESADEYNPQGDMARAIAEKLRKRHQKLAALQPQQGKIDVLSRYSSIISIAMSIELNTITEYTVYQLYDAFKRFQLKMSFDFNIQARMAGASDLDEAEDWMRDIHS